MSYEGYEIAICINGHQDGWPCYDPYESCTVCNGKWAWIASVDTTNGETIEPVPEPETLAEITTCECCGSRSLVKEETYKIPNNCGNLQVGEEEINVPFAPAKFSYGGFLFDNEDEAWKEAGLEGRRV